tara:strand:- start:5116 stop:6357 length:1242 start_codon:yes stop_codon:yes gene_type:complete
MSIALRRKMFKLGGRANTHGMGLTSGLKMKKGGTVPVGVGSGNQPKKMGPDGQMRDAHSLQFLAAPAAAAGRFTASALAPGLRSLIGAIRGPGIRSFLRGDPVSKTLTGKFGTTADLITKIPKTGGLAQLGRALQISAPLTIPGAAAGLTAIPRGEDRSRIANLLSGAGELALDYSPIGLLTSAGSLAFGKKGDPILQLSDLIKGKEPEDETPKTKTQDLPQLAKDTQADAKQKTEDRVAELYEKLGGKGVNKLAALGAGLTAAAAPLLEEDYGAAAAAFQGGLQPEIQRDRDLKDAAAQLAIAEESEERTAERSIESLERAADLEALVSLDAPALIRRERLTKAFDEMGDAVIELPTKIKNKRVSLDTDKLDKNRIYTDTSGLFQQTYVATNSAKQPQAFDNVSQAAAYAQS